MKLTFTNYNINSDYEYSMSAPNDVLLIRKQELKSFFEENKVRDNITSFTTTHNAFATNQYVFSNIARLVTTCINEKQAAKKAAKKRPAVLGMRQSGKKLGTKKMKTGIRYC